MAKNKIVTIPSFSYEDTSDPDVKRFVDRKGDWTHYFIVSQKRYVKAVNHVIRLGFPKGDGFMEYLKRTSPEEADRKLKNAGEEGSRSHQAIKDLESGNRITMDVRYFNEITKKDEKLTDEEWDNLEAYINFCNTYNPEIVANDKVVYWIDPVTGHAFAGTFDSLYTILIPDKDRNFPEYTWGKRVLILIDWKTSSKLWDEYDLQVSAYYNGILQRAMFKEFIEYYGSKHLIFCGLVRLGTKHKTMFELRVLDEGEVVKCWNQFGCSVETAYYREPDFSPDIREIPWQFHYRMRNAEVPVIEVKIKKARKPRKKKENTSMDSQSTNSTLL